MYEVRFIIYQYNSGKSDNGYRKFSEEFPTLEEAQDLAKDIQRLCSETFGTKNGDFARQYVWSGILSRLDGLYKITEEKLQ